MESLPPLPPILQMGKTEVHKHWGRIWDFRGCPPHWSIWSPDPCWLSQVQYLLLATCPGGAQEQPTADKRLPLQVLLLESLVLFLTTYRVSMHKADQLCTHKTKCLHKHSSHPSQTPLDKRRKKMVISIFLTV